MPNIFLYLDSINFSSFANVKCLIFSLPVQLIRAFGKIRIIFSPPYFTVCEIHYNSYFLMLIGFWIQVLINIPKRSLNFGNHNEMCNYDKLQILLLFKYKDLLSSNLVLLSSILCLFIPVIDIRLTVKTIFTISNISKILNLKDSNLFSYSRMNHVV